MDLGAETDAAGSATVSFPRTGAPHIRLRDLTGTDPAFSATDGGSMVTEARSSPLEIRGEIARGGMGAVLRGRDPELGRELAVKVLLTNHSAKRELLRRFVEEAQICGQLQHPGIVPVYGLGRMADGRPFFSMKLVRGETLARVLASRAAANDDWPRLLSIFESICQTVAYAHARGVIHRDLKPSNVMVGAFGEVQVMDWGLAKVLSKAGEDEPKPERARQAQFEDVETARSRDGADLSIDGQAIGTPAYMAPEQARGEIARVDERADVFSLGAMLLGILTGRPPFVADTIIATMTKAARGDLDDAFARLAVSGAEAELMQIARACLAQERDNRPRDAQVVAGQITAYLAGVQDRLRKAELARIEERARRRVTVAVAAAVLLLVIAGTGVGVYLRELRAARRRTAEARVTRAVDEATQLWGQARSAARDDVRPWEAAVRAAEAAQAAIEGGDVGNAMRTKVALLIAQLAKERAQAANTAKELRRDRDLIAKLESIRIDRILHQKAEKTDGDYGQAFREFGADIEKLATNDAGRILRSRSDPVALAAFLDDWAYVRSTRSADEKFWRAPMAVARVIDPNPWRDRLRAQIRGPEKGALARIADDAKGLEGQPGQSLLLLGRWLLAEKDRFRAEAVLTRAWKAEPNDFWVNDLLGSMYTWDVQMFGPQWQPQLASRYYSVTVALRPNSATTHINLAYALCTWKLDEAIAETREAVRLNPKSLAAHLNLGVYLNTKEDFRGVIAAYNEALRLEPNRVHAHLGIAIARSRLGEFDDATLSMREAVRLEPENTNLHNGLAYLLTIRANRPARDYQEGLDYARRAVAKAGNDHEVLATLAQAEYRVGHFRDAIDAAERSDAAGKDPNASAQFIQAMVQKHLGDLEAASARFGAGVTQVRQRPRVTIDSYPLGREAAGLLGTPVPDVLLRRPPTPTKQP
jgi:serine/threonine-protein kinase